MYYVFDELVLATILGWIICGL